jgi:hypothetical protein
MRDLFAEAHPGSTLIRTDDPGWEERVTGCDRLVLLYPDATGLGWAPLERRVSKLVESPPTVLSGRRRSFELDRPTLRALRLRRALERSMAGEAIGLLLIGLATPALVAWDLVRGRR